MLKNRKAWLTEGLKQSIKFKNKLYVKYINKPSSFNHKHYKMYRNKLHQVLRTAERNHYDTLLIQHKGNIRKSWSIIKEVITKKKQMHKSSKFFIDNKFTSDNCKIADAFNKFYVNIGPTLAKKINHSNIEPTSYINEYVPESMFVSPTDGTEVSNIISSLKEASSGYDDVTSKIVKVSYEDYIQPLTHVINLSLVNGIVPQELKIAKVIPLFKNGDATIVNNYRPVSVLPLFSKILEKIMYKRLLSFINKHKILHDYQFGFRKNHGTDLALIIIMDKITQALQNKENVIGVFLDFSKAFDTVNHNILLQKLYKYGVRGSSHQWFASYLCDRKQFVSFNNISSSLKSISCGVPQGSILGPLLFLLYINDINNVSKVLFSILFADDTNVFVSGKNINELVVVLNRELSKLVTWLQVNKLSLNVKKTHYMVFSPPKVNQDISPITMNGEKINRVSSTRFLGVVIDDKLKWNEHILFVKQKVSKGLGIICKAKKKFSKGTLRTLYYSFIYPYLMYGIVVWGSANHNVMQPLMKIHKRCIRVITLSSWKAHTAELFRSTRVLQIDKVFIYSVMLFMYKFHKNKLPCILNKLFTVNNVIHGHFTRQSSQLHVTASVSLLVKKSIRSRGVYLWNTMSSKININHSVHCFKNSLKSYLLNHDVLIFPAAFVNV